jgi:DNA repair photolyase
MTEPEGKAKGFRWSTADGDEPALFSAAELFLPELGTGRMSGLEFLHVTAKRILNHVPSGSRAPSNWTINVYRGCSHACSYCLAGETPILLADGRTRSIADLRPGDRVYGTTFDGKYRRYVATDVLDHWRTMKRAYRVTLEDGTRLTASGDHRFLTGRGWKHVAPAVRPAQRPHLTLNNELLGLGRLAPAARHDEEYRRGYLTGMIRGDAHLGSYHYERPGRAHGDVHRFRLALVDVEPLDRSREFLHGFGVPTATFEFAKASQNRRPLTAIRNSSKAAVERIQELITWPAVPTDQWRLGFLAGIFDAEGSHSCGVLRISNGDPEILEHTLASARRFDFTPVLEPARDDGVRSVRIAGGLRERLRFFLSTDPATTRKRTIDDVAIKSDAKLRVVAIEDLGIDMPMYDITTGTGDFVADGVVSHNCFARPTHEYLGFNSGDDFDRKIVVKINAVERLRVELADPAWTHEGVAMGTNTDPYQRCEGKYRLTRGVVETLTEHANPFSILTKSPLVLRDAKLITEAARKADVSVNFSVGTLDERVWRATEPGTPHPRRRIEAMRALAEAGVPTGALIAPVLPGLSDSPEQLGEVAQAIRDVGGRVIGTIPLHLRRGVREHFLGWLAGFDPVLHAEYRRRYAASAYAPAHYAEHIRALAMSDARGANPERAPQARSKRRPTPRGGKQPR